MFPTSSAFPPRSDAVGLGIFLVALELDEKWDPVKINNTTEAASKAATMAARPLDGEERGNLLTQLALSAESSNESKAAA